MDLRSSTNVVWCSRFTVPVDPSGNTRVSCGDRRVSGAVSWRPWSGAGPRRGLGEGCAWRRRPPLRRVARGRHADGRRPSRSMPSVYCTQCGHANPDDARFCSNCGTPLRSSAPPPPRESPGESTSTISIGGFEALDTDAGAEEPAGPDQMAMEALPRAPRCSSSSEGPTPAAASCSTRTARPPDGTPRATSSWTTSPSPAGTPSSRGRAARSPSGTPAASTAPTSTGSGSTRPGCRAATRSRSASSGWCS